MSEAPVTREEFEALLLELRDVKARLQEFEAKFNQPEEISEETLQVIAAAVAAYLGERATIRVVRKGADSDLWSLQGRAALQGSHSMARTRGLHR